MDDALNDGRMQMFPLLRVAVMVVCGIVCGLAMSGDMHVTAWGVATAAAILSAVAFHGHSLAQSVIIHAAAFAAGGFLAACELNRITVLEGDRTAEYEAVVVSSPVEYGKTIGCDIIITTTPRPVKARAYFYKDERARLLDVGSGVRATSTLHPSYIRDGKEKEKAGGGKGGNFNFPLYLISHGFSATTFVSSWNWQGTAIDIRRLSLMQRTRLRALTLRRHLLDQYSSWGFQGQTLAVLSALTLGDKSMLSRQTRDEYSTAGVSHILALSGMHLTIIYAILATLAGRYRRKLAAELFITCSIWAFVFITGMSTSVTRAALMITVYAFCDMLNSGRTPLNTLSFAALAILVASPLSLYDVGFQLSFMAMLTIGLFFPMLRSATPRLITRFKLTDFMVSAILLSISAQIGTFPLVAYYFGETPLYSLVANIIVAFGATTILYGAAFFFLCTPLPFIRTYIADGLAYTAECMNAAIAHIASLPAANILNFEPSAAQTALIYVIVFAAWRLTTLLRDLFAKEKV